MQRVENHQVQVVHKHTHTDIQASGSTTTAPNECIASTPEQIQGAVPRRRGRPPKNGKKFSVAQANLPNEQTNSPKLPPNNKSELHPSKVARKTKIVNRTSPVRKSERLQNENTKQMTKKNTDDST